MKELTKSFITFFTQTKFLKSRVLNNLPLLYKTPWLNYYFQASPLWAGTINVEPLIETTNCLVFQKNPCADIMTVG